MPAIPVLTDGSITKSTGDKIRVSFDFGNIQAIIALLTDSDGNFDPDATAIASYNVTTTGTGAPTISSIQLDSEYNLSCVVTGGSVGTYSLTFSVVLVDPDATQISRVAPLTIK